MVNLCRKCIIFPPAMHKNVLPVFLSVFDTSGTIVAPGNKACKIELCHEKTRFFHM